MNHRSATATSIDRVRLPAYIIGQDPEGHWIAVETHGSGGGLFRSRTDAIRFARFESPPGSDPFRLALGPVSLPLPGQRTASAAIMPPARPTPRRR